MAGRIYFGNSTIQKWIKAPNSSMDAATQGYSSRSDFLNGSASVRRSKRTHREFSLSWTGQINAVDQDQNVRPIKDFHDGLFGSGPFYWVDPFAATGNILAPEWASPMLAESGWQALSNSIVPTYTAQTYANGFPIKYASYSLPASHSEAKKFTVIIPDGYKFTFGWHSTASGKTADADGGIKMVKYNRSTGVGTTVYPASMTAGGVTRTNTTVDGATFGRVEIYLYNGATSTKSVNIVGMMGQVIPSSSNTPSGEFISGNGTNGLEFSSPPSINYISAALDGGMVEISTTMTEVI